ERSVALLAAELGSARRFGATIVNVHIGSHGGAGIESGIERLVAAVGRALEMENDPDSVGEAHVGEADDVDGQWPGMPLEIDLEATTTPPMIVFENSVGSGFGLGVTVDELASIAGALHAADVPDDRVGFCLDTAHAWGAGYELSDPAVTDKLLDELDR